MGLPLTAAVLAGAIFLWSHRPQDPEQLWQQGQASFEAGRIDRAEAAVQRLARLRAPTINDWLLRAEVDMARGRTDSALSAIEHVPDSSPMAPQTRLRAGNLELARNHARAAEAQWLKALTLDPALIAARRALSYLYAVQLRRAEFDAQFERIAEQSPVTFEHAYFWSQIVCGIFDPAEASAQLEKFLAADPGDRSSRLALFEVLLERERPEDAAKLLAALPEDDVDARAARARIALLRREDAEAERLARAGPDDHPGLARVRGRLALFQRDANAAVRQYRRALTTDPDDPETLQGLSKALRLAGDGDAARGFEERLRLRSHLWELVQSASRGSAQVDLALLRDLARTSEALGWTGQARAWYSQVIARSPLDAEAQRALFRLSKIERPASPPAESR